MPRKQKVKQGIKKKINKTTFNYIIQQECTRINVNIFMDFLVHFFLQTPDLLQMLDHKQHCIVLFTKGELCLCH